MRRRSFKEVQLLLVTSIFAAAVTPFAFIQLQDQQWPVALLDFGVVAVMLGLFAHVFVSQETRRPAIVVTLIFSVAALGTFYLQGASYI